MSYIIASYVCILSHTVCGLIKPLLLSVHKNLILCLNVICTYMHVCARYVAVWLKAIHYCLVLKYI